MRKERYLNGAQIWEDQEFPIGRPIIKGTNGNNE
jgi:hypothetical protein